MAQPPSKTPDTTERDLADRHPFTIHPSISRFEVNLSTFIQNNSLTTDSSKPIPIHHLATGAIVISTHRARTTNSPLSQTANALTEPPPPRVLLLRRAPTDSMPNLWEVPGGAVDSTDSTILAGVARELREETSLAATAVGPLVGSEVGQFFSSRSGRLIAKFHFLVDVEATEAADVRCDPAEHSEWAWVEEADVESETVGGTEMKFTTREQRAVVLEGFKLWKEQGKTSEM